MSPALGILTSLVVLAIGLGIIALALWGGIVLARKLVADPLGSVLLGILFGLIFLVAGITALVAGCIALAGSPSFR